MYLLSALHGQGTSSTSSSSGMPTECTRATSPGSDSARYEFGRLACDSVLNVPAATISAHSRSYSSADPSHHWMRSGSLRAATSSTQASRRSCLVGAGAYVLIVEGRLP